VHDRRIDGRTEVFGNASTLFMTAMTWYDHRTRSIWSQPWGRAIQGELKGIELFLLPSQIATWDSWVTAYPETLVMTNGTETLGRFREGFETDFVIGLIWDGQAAAYYYEDVESKGVVNDAIGTEPILVWAQDERFHAYLRTLDEEVLTFKITAGELIDEQTGSLWDPARGLAIEGPFEGEALRPVPGSTAFDWAWMDFYPETEFYLP
jgi:hypothetical protein